MDALRVWLRACVRMMATKKGMVAALAPSVDPSSEFLVDTASRVRRSLTGLMDRARSTGQLRDDVSSEDVLRAVVGLCYTREQPGWQDAVIHLLDVFVDGLTTHPKR